MSAERDHDDDSRTGVEASDIRLSSEWRSRSTDILERLSNASPLCRQSLLVEKRLLGFLSQTYGPGNWRRDVHSDRNVSSELRFFETDEGLAFGGKPPKSSGLIRKSLKKISVAFPGYVPVGPRVDGLRAEDWVTIAAESSNISPNTAQRVLWRRGIPSRVTHVGDDLLVQVRMSDRGHANQLLATARNEIRARRPLRRRNPPLWFAHQLHDNVLLPVALGIAVLPIVVMAIAIFRYQALHSLYLAASIAAVILIGLGCILWVHFGRRFVARKPQVAHPNETLRS